ncbi:hypothetical protein Q8W43_20525 [Klebsiella pneumoniae]|nr:hypothetical protein Q8W43_20525 [Klebsiella pneumoniae]
MERHGLCRAGRGHPALTEKYTVDYIGIDATGIGRCLPARTLILPGARAIRYTPEMKTAMVLKAKDTIRRGCLEYDAGATDITSHLWLSAKP